MQRYRDLHPEEAILYLDAGRAFPLRTQETDVVVPFMMEGFRELGLDVFNVGEVDLDGGIGFMTALMREAGIPAVSANLVDIDSGRPVFPPYTIVTGRDAPGSPRVAVVGFTEPQRYEILAAPDGSKVHFGDVLKVAADVIPRARSEADAVIVLANFGTGTARRVAEATPGIDLIIGNDERIHGVAQDQVNGVPIVMTGVLGKRSIRADFRKGGGDRPWTVELDVVELDEGIPDDPAGAALMERFDRVLSGRTRERAEAQRGDPRATAFLGSAACASCHPAEFEAWSASRHAHAWEPLTESKNTMNPLCIQCHSTGYLKPNGFFIEAGQPHLVAVGCESCHGAGGKHVADPFRAKLARGDESSCRGCHTAGQTPDFDFAQFWPRIQHSPERAVGPRSP